MPATNFQEAVDLAQVLVNIFESFVKGDTTVVIDTDGGPVPSLAKFMADKDNQINAGANSILQLSVNAKNSAQAASTSANSAWDAFRGTYFGRLATDPSVDPLGNPLEEGDHYFNTALKALRYWNGTVWYTPNQSANEAQATADQAIINAAAAQTKADAALPRAGGKMTGAFNQATPVTIASGPTMAIGAAASNTILVTGSATITAFDDIPAGAQRRLRFGAALTIQDDGTGTTPIVLPSRVNLVVAVDDEAVFESLGSSRWKCIGVHRQAAADAVAPEVRQTVLDASVDANGMPNYLTAGSGLNVTLAASTGSPVEMTSANGTKNRRAVLTSNATIPVAANATNYLYADINADGTATLGSSTIAPIYQFAGAPGTGNGVFTFNYGRYSQTVGNGATAAASWRVYLGEAVTGASSVTSVIAYALRGVCATPLVTPLPANGAVMTASHNLGINEGVVAALQTVCKTADAGFSVGQVIHGGHAFSNGASYLQAAPGVTRNSVSAGIPTGAGVNDVWLVTNPGGAVSTINLTKANWSWRYLVKRSW